VGAKTRLFALISLFTLIVTVLWLVLLIVGMGGAGPFDTFEQVVAQISRQDTLFTLTYLNATLTVLGTTALFTVLYLCCRAVAPELALLGLVFVPLYAALNLSVYLSQLTVVPSLLAFRQQAGYEAAAGLLLRQVVQQWPASGVSFINNLGYAILGIPSIVFGLILAQWQGARRWAGILLALTGVACLVGVAGILLGSRLLGNGSVVGGLLYLLALIPLNIAFWQGR